MLSLKIFLTVFVCLTAVVSNVNAFHPRFFDSYEDDWHFKRPIKKPILVSESVEVPVEEIKPLDVVPPDYESKEGYYRPKFHSYGYGYEPKPFYSSYGYGYRPHYGKK